MANTPATTIVSARWDTRTNIDQYPDAIAYIDINNLKDYIQSTLVTSWKASYVNWQMWFANTVANQSNWEYKLDIVSSSNPWLKTLNSLYICFGDTFANWNLNYTKCREVDIKNQDYDWNYYLNNQDKIDPIYFQKDNSVFIAPYSATVVTSGLKMEWIRKIADYTSWTTEAETGFPSDFNYIFRIWLIPNILQYKGSDDWSINNARVIFENRLSLVIGQIWYKEEHPTSFTYPEVSNIYNINQINLRNE